MASCQKFHITRYCKCSQQALSQVEDWGRLLYERGRPASLRGVPPSLQLGSMLADILKRTDQSGCNSSFSWPLNDNKKLRIHLYLYISSCVTLNETITAKNIEISLRNTLMWDQKSEIFTPEPSDRHPCMSLLYMRPSPRSWRPDQGGIPTFFPSKNVKPIVYTLLHIHVRFIQDISTIILSANWKCLNFLFPLKLHRCSWICLWSNYFMYKIFQWLFKWKFLKKCFYLPFQLTISSTSVSIRNYLMKFDPRFSALLRIPVNIDSNKPPPAALNPEKSSKRKKGDQDLTSEEPSVHGTILN